MYGMFMFLHLVDFYGFCVGKYTSPMQKLWLGIHLGEAYGPRGPW